MNHNFILFPLGGSCKLKYSIDRYYNNNIELNFFDRVLTNFDTILYFIKNIDKEIIKDDFFDSNINIFEKRIVNFKNCRFSSVNDFPLNIRYEQHLPIFIDMLNIRLKKLKNNIINNLALEFVHILDAKTEYNFKCNPVLPPSNFY